MCRRVSESVCVGLRLSDLTRRWALPKARSMGLGGQRFHARPSTLLQQRRDLPLDDVPEVRRPPVGLEGVLVRVALVE